jgi:hypothetical protein
MQLDELELLTQELLRQRANDAFALADEKGPGYLAQAQFYISELDRRENRKMEKERDDREKIRWRIDLILELLIVVLIGFELWVGGCEADKQLAALNNLQKSSASTAERLESLQKTTEEMNRNIGTEVGLNYDVAVEITFDNQVKHVNIANKGRTNVYVWGDKLDQQKPLIDTKGRMIAPGGSYYIIADTFYGELGTKLPKGSQRLVPFSVFLKNENGDEFIVECQFFAVWYLDNLTIHTQTTSVRRAKWDGRDK